MEEEIELLSKKTAQQIPDNLLWLN